MQPNTYRAIEVSSPGSFQLVEREITEPPRGKVRIRVEACGICHTDAVTVERLVPTVSYPRVPGHEVIGKIDAIGADVEHWGIGQRVAVGYLGGPCLHCTPCRRGDFVSCLNQGTTGISYDGGYAEVMIADQYALSAVPEELSATEAAPLICAGLTTYDALRNSRARAGDLVVIQGVGGLGHLGIQFARAMGFRVAAIARGSDKAPLALQLGARHYIDSQKEDPVAALQTLGGAVVILATAASGKSMSALIGGLAPRGHMVVVGVGGDSLDIPGAPLVLSSRSIDGALTGSAIDGEDTLSFSVLGNIRAMIETVPLDQAADAYARMMQGKARFRMVLTTGQ